MLDSARRPARWAAAIALTAIAGFFPAVALTPADAAFRTTAPYCGPAVKKSTGGYWRCTLADEFSGTSLNPNVWSALRTSESGVQTPECRIDLPETLRVASGSVHMTAVRRDNYLCESPAGDYMTDYVGGGIHSRSKFTQAFGRFEARIKFPGSSEAGLHGAWWMWPQKSVYGALAGELDVAEWRSALAGRVAPAVQYEDGGLDPEQTYWHCYISDVTQWHTYAMEWTTDGTVRFIYDGQLCWQKKVVSASGLVSPAPFDENFFMILNQGIGAGHNPPSASTVFPATMSVDYVKVWK